MTDAEHYSTQWAVAEDEPPPAMYVIELERNHVYALIGAARAAAIVPGLTLAEVELLNAAADTLISQTVNL